MFRIYLRILQRRNDEAIAEARSLLARTDEPLEGFARASRSISDFASAAGERRPRRDTFAAV